MKLTVICLFFIVFSLAAEFSSAEYNGKGNIKYYGSRRDSNWNLMNGYNYQSKNGRHNTNINWTGGRYNYAGNRWNTNVNHNWFDRQTNLNANYRQNHNFRAGYNWQNRQTNLGYTYNFGKRRRRSTNIEDEMMEFFKMESEPRIFLLKLQSAVNMFVKTYQYTIPELEILSVTVPDDQITNVTVAQEIVCVVKKLQRIFPKTLGNFIVKMIKFHGPSFDIKDLRDFFSVDPVHEFETEDDDSSKDDCELPEVPASSELVDSGRLLAVKTFVATLITVAMEYQQMLEE